MINYKDTIANIYANRILQEELDSSQRKKVDNMPTTRWPIRELHDSVFGKGKEKIIMPYDPKENDFNKVNTNYVANNREIPEHTKHVLGQLRSNGYRTDDYAEGLAYHTDTPDRKMKIGKILEKEDFGKENSNIMSKGDHRRGVAPKVMTTAQVYAADPFRAAHKDQHQIVISRNRYDVAGMSTDRGWSSCMNMGDGHNKRFLHNDMNNGTLTAYVTKKGDDEIKNPVGRVNLKSFENGGHIIFRPEGNYGTMPKGAVQHIHDWAEKNYPSKPGFYMKTSDLYNDNGESMKIEKPEELHTADFKETHKNINHTLSDMIKGMETRRDHQNNSNNFNDDHTDWNGNITRQTHEIYDALPPHVKLQHAIHNISDRTNDDVKPDHFEHSDMSELGGYDAQHEWAKSYIDNGGRTNSEMLKEIGKLKPEEALAHHAELHKSGVSAREIDDHPEHHEIHAHIIDHILRHSPQEHKDKVLTDITDDKGDSPDYYTHVTDTANTILDSRHATGFTHNPRLMHSILNTGADHLPNVDLDHYHIGAHADDKLAHEMVHGELSHHLADDSNGSFFRGLNVNPHGEDITHHLISGINLHGGESRGQTKYHPAGYRTINGKVVIPPHHSSNFQELSNDHDQHERYRDIARNSIFPSVHETMKNRDDLKSDTDIQDSLSKNIHYHE